MPIQRPAGFRWNAPSGKADHPPSPPAHCIPIDGLPTTLASTAVRPPRQGVRAICAGRPRAWLPCWFRPQQHSSRCAQQYAVGKAPPGSDQQLPVRGGGWEEDVGPLPPRSDHRATHKQNGGGPERPHPWPVETDHRSVPPGGCKRQKWDRGPAVLAQVHISGVRGNRSPTARQGRIISKAGYQISVPACSSPPTTCWGWSGRVGTMWTVPFPLVSAQPQKSLPPLRMPCNGSCSMLGSRQ